MTPADKKLYALRDVTGTVENTSLIAASIMCKKIAAGAGAILLDVKTGKGSFMKTREEAFYLAETMLRIGKEMGRRIVSVVTDMNQPLGFAVGNALEVKEAISILKGEGPADAETLCIVLGGYMLTLAGKVRNPEEGQDELRKLLNNGAALEKFKQMISSQGGNAQCVDDLSLLPQSKLVAVIEAPKAGYISEIDTRKVGKAAALLGAGRSYKGEEIDPSAGIVLAQIHGNKEELLQAACKDLINAFAISDETPEELPLVYGVVPPFPS
jgi:pyrimidine-nucleoside phosphorylase